MRKNRGPSIGSVVACAWCQEEFVKDHARRVTCSATCSQLHRHRHVDRPCEWCGKSVAQEKHGSHRPTCSVLCRSAVTKWDRGPVLSKWAVPRAKPLPVILPRFVGATCADCGARFVADRKHGFSVQGDGPYCSDRCKRRSGNRRRRAREFDAPGSFRWAEVIGLFLRFGKRCAYCDQHIDGQPDPDHVVPLKRGGSNDISNILPACRLCNSDKCDLTLDEWAEDRARRTLPLVRCDFSGPDRRWSHLVLREAAGTAGRSLSKA